MNFKLKKKKVIASIFIPVILWLIFAFTKFSNSTGIIRKFVDMHDYSNLFSSGNIILFVIEVVVIFIILSAFQNEYAV